MASDEPTEEDEEAQLAKIASETRLRASLRNGRSGGTPPAEHQFKKGVSGNPGGRPKSLLTPIVRQLLEAEDKRYAEIVARAWVQLACRGQPTALKQLLDRLDGPPTEP
jgi:hypothetical protein